MATYRGTDGNDTLNGGAGDDTLDGDGYGDDSLNVLINQQVYMRLSCLFAGLEAGELTAADFLLA